ncbi:MAG: universal stress protein [Candidatus Latescibacterota bacterium]
MSRNTCPPELEEVEMQPVNLHTVLAAVDFSEWTGPVLQAAAEMARRYGARLSAVYAEMFLPPPYFTQRAIGPLAQVLEVQKEAARDQLAHTVTEALGEGVSVDARLVEAPPVEGILRTAEREQAGLVVMGTHGRSGLNRLLLGSVAERVVRQATVPVLTVRGPVGAGAGGPVRLARILCPYNYTPVAREALRYAVDLAQRGGGELVLATSLEEGGSEEEARRHRERLCADVPAGVQSRCALRPVVRRGPAAEEVLRLAAEEAPDLIVIGAQHRPLLETTVIGTTSVRVMRHAPCPVLTVSRR